MEVISSDSESESINSVDLCQSKSEGPLVYLRLKPVDYFCNFYTVDMNSKRLLTSQPNGTEKQFVFTDIFEELVTQREVYEQCVQSRIDNMENFTIMSYGTSGSGKTFTLIGKPFCWIR